MSEPTRRIMNRIGEKTYLPVINVEEADAVPLVGFPVVGLIVGSRLHSLGTILGVVVGVFVGVAVVRAAPSHLTAMRWFRDLARYYFRRPEVTTRTATDGGAPDGTTSLTQYNPFVPDETTTDLTGLERAWSGSGAVERADGTMEGWIEVHPRNMDFAMQADWGTLQDAGRRFANEDLAFDLTFYATTRPFPAEEMVEALDDRRDDPDVQDNPVFRELLDEYRARRPADLADVQELHYYLGVEVTRQEVYERYETDQTPLERLAELPVVGPLVFARFVTRRADLSEADLRERMFEKLSARVGVVEDRFVRELTGWSSRRLSTLEIFLLAMDFWNGTTHAGVPKDRTHLLNEVPAAGSQSRVDPVNPGGDDS